MVMWIARDREGWLCLYKEKPVRQLVEEFWIDADINYYLDYKEDGIGCFKIIDSELYPELTWEDEPIEIENLLMKESDIQSGIKNAYNKTKKRLDMQSYM